MRLGYKKRKRSNEGFRYRGLSGSRIETLTDTIFGFSITLLVISSEVPSTYLELQASMYSFAGFIFCTLLLLSIWNNHKVFYLRYGLQDGRTGILNFLLLFVLLFYIYPLKYLFSYLGTAIYATVKLSMGDTSEGLKLVLAKLRESGLSLYQWSDIMVRFGFGLFLIYTIFMLMHMNAVNKKKKLGLNRKETYITKTSVQAFLILIMVTLLSITIVLIFGGSKAEYSGLAYLLIPILLPLHKWIRTKRYRNRQLVRKDRKNRILVPLDDDKKELSTKDYNQTKESNTHNTEDINHHPEGTKIAEEKDNNESGVS